MKEENRTSVLPKLTPDQKEHLIPLLVEYLKAGYRSGQPVSATNITEAFYADGYKVKGPLVRKLISYICLTDKLILPGMVLIASNYGYSLTNDIATIEAWEASLIDRIEAMKARLQAIDKQKRALALYQNYVEPKAHRDRTREALNDGIVNSELKKRLRQYREDRRQTAYISKDLTGGKQSTLF